jgi:pantetheine-phosphate adenylyltransferase
MNNRIAVVPVRSIRRPSVISTSSAAPRTTLHVLVVHNPGKEAMLPIAQR